MHTTFSPDHVQPTRGFTHLANLFGRLYGLGFPRSRGHAPSRDVLELYGMDDHMLADIGLTRLDVLRMMEKSRF